MNRHRFKPEAAEIRLPQPPPPVTAETFMLCPAAMFPGLPPEQMQCVQWLYQQAFAEAQAVARPSILERDLLGVWN